MALSPGARLGPYEVLSALGRFLVNTRIEDAPSPINIILNWTALLEK